MSETICLACKWSGVDDAIYRANGCPSCICYELKEDRDVDALEDLFEKYEK